MKRATIERRIGIGRAWSAASALAALMLVLGASAGSPVGRIVTASPASRLYVGTWDSPAYAALDPQTLADAPDRPDLAVDVENGWVQSADGGVLAEFKQASGEIVVRDLATGEEHARVRPPQPIDYCCLAVSRDGSRVVVLPRHEAGGDGVQPRVWATLETRSGDLLPEVRTDGGAWEHVVADPDARRLYHLFGGEEINDPRPSPVSVTAYDLSTGAVIGRTEVAAVQVLSYWDGSVMHSETPSVALAPDGRRLALVHVGVDKVTLLDAATLSVERTITVAPKPSVAGMTRVLRWLGVMPIEASAKVYAGRYEQAIFSPDGRHLYVSGYEIEPAENPAEATEIGFGLRRIDLATGEIVAATLAGERIDQVAPAADGSALYAIGPTKPWLRSTGEPAYRLRRLDPRTLEPLAEREFLGYRQIVLLPAASPSR